jgi:hypothetical protein
VAGTDVATGVLAAVGSGAGISAGTDVASGVLAAGVGSGVGAGSDASGLLFNVSMMISFWPF